MKNITKEEWKELIASTENKVLLDVRTPKECAEGIQPDAIQLNFLDQTEFLSGAEKLDKNKTYFIYCRSGNRSGQACQMLKKYGITETYNLEGGMNEWDGNVV